jgi:hypothetical protein
MAFCTVCGASVNGVFCTQCGTPAGQAGAAQRPPMPAPAPPMPAPAPQMAAPVPSQVLPPGPPPGRKTSPIVWILVIVLGIAVLATVAVVGAGFFFVHKAKQAGLDPSLIQKNPGMAIARMMAAANPDTEVVSTDENAGTITVRDKKTGKVITMTFDQVKSGGLKFTAKDEKGETAVMEFGGSTGKLPAWIPAYPGAEVKGTFTMRGDGGDGMGEGGNFGFTTKDSPAQVEEFYQEKAKELGMKVNLTTHADKGGMIMAADEDNKRTLTVVIAGEADETTVNVTYGLKR